MIQARWNPDTIRDADHEATPSGQLVAVDQGDSAIEYADREYNTLLLKIPDTIASITKDSSVSSEAFSDAFRLEGINSPTRIFKTSADVGLIIVNGSDPIVAPNSPLINTAVFIEPNDLIKVGHNTEAGLGSTKQSIFQVGTGTGPGEFETIDFNTENTSLSSDTPGGAFIGTLAQVDVEYPVLTRVEGLLWWNTEEGVLYTWYDDGNHDNDSNSNSDSAQWVVTNASTGGNPATAEVVVTLPDADDYNTGDLVYLDSDIDDGGARLYIKLDDINGDGRWIDASIPGGSLTETTGDLRYLSKTSDDTASGEITFQGVTTHEAGVSVTGNTSTSGADDTVYPLIYSADLAGGMVLTLKPRGANLTESVGLTLCPPQATGKGGGVVINHNKTLDKEQDNNLRITGNWSGDYAGAGGSTAFFNSYLLVSADTRGSTTSTDKPITGIGVGLQPDANTHFIGVRATGKPVSSPAAAEWIGVKSEISLDHATTAYNFFAGGNAPNYFAGGVQFDIAAGTDALEDYEEGDYTPKLIGSGVGGNYTAQVGKYVKVGRVVTVYVEIVFTGAGNNATQRANEVTFELPFVGDGSSSTSCGLGGSTTIYNASNANSASVLGETIVVSIRRNTNEGIISFGGDIRDINLYTSKLTYENLREGMIRTTMTYNTKD